MLRSTCLMMLIFAGVAAADVQTGLVRSGGVAIPGATVSAECGTDKITTTTDDAGRFEMGGLPSTSCKYTVLMFGFEPVQKDAAASSTPLTFDLALQGHATEPVAPKPAAPVVTSNEPKPATPATPPPAAAPPAPATPDVPPPSMIAAQNAANAPRGGRGRGARGATGATGPTGRGAQQAQNGRGGRGGANNNNGGFQNLSLVQNEDAPAASDAPASTLGNVDSGVATGDSFTVNGTITQSVQAQAGDGMGMGGAGGFGFGPGGPGGAAFGADGLGGPGGDQGGAPGGRGGGGRGGAGGPGGGGGRGGGGAAGFAAGGGGGFGGGGRGGGGFGGGGRGGGPGGRGGRGPNGTTAFGNRAGRGRGPQWQAAISYNFQNSALNARPYDLASATTSGIAPVKPATANNQLGITLGGPIMIPKTKVNLRNSHWNVNITGARNRTGVENVSSVPTAAMRTGDFSSVLATNIIYDPLNNTPFPNNVIPQSRLSPSALSLLSLYPSPTGVGLVKNYEFDASNPSNTNTFTSQISEPITTKDRVNVNLSAQSRNSANYQTFGYRDPTSGGGKAATISYARTLQPTLVNTFSIGVNRNVTNNTSYFCPAGSSAASCAGDLGNIASEIATPLEFGPPTLSFQNFNGVTDSTPTTNHSFTYQFTNTIAKTHGKHNMQIGVNFTRRESNSVTASGSRGSFSFTGVNTEEIVNGSPQQQLAPGVQSGYDLADFLLGAPASGSITAYKNGDAFYYRQKSAYAFFNDDFRLSTKVTLNGGLRWEFYAPQTEKYNHMSNLVFSPNFTNVAIATPGSTNAWTQSPTPNGLIPADYKMYEPQIGIAAKPWSKRPITFRAGYGIRYNGGALAGQGSRLAAQYPFVQSFSLTPAQALLDGTSLTLGPFPTLPTGVIPNTYAIAPNYKPAMAQQWNAIVAYSLGARQTWVAQLAYYGTKGSNLDVLLGPNRATPGPSSAQAEASRVPIPYATTSIQYDESIGTSIYHAGQAQITRRLARGLGLSGTYTLAKSIDDSSTLGAGVVENENNILAERAVTASVPHETFALNFNYQTLSGNQHSEFYWNLIRGWRLNGGYNVSSGTPFTATVSGDPTGTGINGTRANATGLPVTGGDCSTCTYFNTAAFGPVTSGTFGTAGRNTIPGIVNFSMNASASRSFQIGERHRLQLTFTTNNPLNHPSITGIGTVFGSNTYGLATAAGAMRTVSANARFTF